VASHVNSNFETLRRRIDTVSTSLATTQTALTAAEARYVPLAGGTMTGALTMTGARAILGGNSAGNIHIDASSAGSDGRTYVNWYGGKGIVLGNGSGGAIATLDSATSTTTINGRRVPSEIVKKSCTSSGTCTATCPTGTVIKLAFGFHGLAPNGTSGDWTCGGAYQWLGGCSDQTSCTVNAGCGSSGVWLECW